MFKEKGVVWLWILVGLLVIFFGCLFWYNTTMPVEERLELQKRNQAEHVAKKKKEEAAKVAREADFYHTIAGTISVVEVISTSSGGLLGGSVFYKTIVKFKDGRVKVFNHLPPKVFTLPPL